MHLSDRRGRALSISCVIYHNIHYAYSISSTMDGRVPIAVTAVYADGGPLSLPIPRDVDPSKLSAHFDPNRLGQFRRTDAQTTLISTSVSTSAGSSPSSSPRLRLGAGGAEAIRTYGTASRH